MNNFQIIRDSNPLTRRVWTFWFDNHLTLQLNSYVEQTKPSKRHRNWTAQLCWYRMSYERTSYTPKLAERPQVPADVADEAMRVVIGQLRFGFEVAGSSERKQIGQRVQLDVESASIRGRIMFFGRDVYDGDGENLVDIYSDHRAEAVAVVAVSLADAALWAESPVEIGGYHYCDGPVYLSTQEQREIYRPRAHDRRPRIFTFANGSEIDVDRYLGLDATAISRTDSGDRPAITFQLGHGGFLRVAFESEQQRVDELARLRAFRDGAA